MIVTAGDLNIVSAINELNASVNKLDQSTKILSLIMIFLTIIISILTFFMAKQYLPFFGQN